MIASQSKKVSPYLFDGQYRPFKHSAKTGRPKKVEVEVDKNRTYGASRMAKRLAHFRSLGLVPYCDDDFRIVPVITPHGLPD